jgi:hypothetical protein
MAQAARDKARRFARASGAVREPTHGPVHEVVMRTASEPLAQGVAMSCGSRTESARTRARDTPMSARQSFMTAPQSSGNVRATAKRPHASAS